MYAIAMAEIVNLLLRLPSDMHATLTEWARREQRSLHGQIIYLLRRAIEERGSG